MTRHLRLVANNSLPLIEPSPSPRRLDREVVDAARRWADEVHAARLRPDSSPAGRATRDLLDALHDLEHFETTNTLREAQT